MLQCCSGVVLSWQQLQTNLQISLADHCTDINFLLRKLILMHQKPLSCSAPLLLELLRSSDVGICYHHALFYTVHCVQGV